MNARAFIVRSAVLAGLLGSMAAQAATPEPLVYHDGDMVHHITRESGWVAPVRLPAQAGQSGGVSSPRVLGLERASAMQTRRAVQDPALRFSEVYRESGQLMALPGGVLVKVKPDWRADDVQLWLGRRGLQGRPLAGLVGSWYLVDTPPGMAALKLANELHETGELLAATPNWWRQRQAR